MACRRLALAPITSIAVPLELIKAVDEYSQAAAVLRSPPFAVPTSSPHVDQLLALLDAAKNAARDMITKAACEALTQCTAIIDGTSLTGKHLPPGFSGADVAALKFAEPRSISHALSVHGDTLQGILQLDQVLVDDANILASAKVAPDFVAASTVFGSALCVAERCAALMQGCVCVSQVIHPVDSNKAQLDTYRQECTACAQLVLSLSEAVKHAERALASARTIRSFVATDDSSPGAHWLTLATLEASIKATQEYAARIQHDLVTAVRGVFDASHTFLSSTADAIIAICQEVKEGDHKGKDHKEQIAILRDVLCTPESLALGKMNTFMQAWLADLREMRCLDVKFHDAQDDHNVRVLLGAKVKPAQSNTTGLVAILNKKGGSDFCERVLKALGAAKSTLCPVIQSELDRIIASGVNSQVTGDTAA